MEIKDYASKLVKPSIPTPSTLRNYNISFFDELASGGGYIPLIIYYHAPQNGHFENISNHLENSLSDALSEFYPLAGRYISHGSFIECSDQGAPYVEANANFNFSEFLVLKWDLKLKWLDKFLLSKVGETMLTVKITTFKCGGVAIGMCFSHMISDVGSICMFIDNWAARSRQVGVDELRKYAPNFSMSRLFPRGGLGLPNVGGQAEIGVTKDGENFIMQTFLFKGNKISALREKLIFEDNTCHRPSKVKIVEALLWKALLGIDQAITGELKGTSVTQPVNLRDKVIPKLPENSYGNFGSLANARIELDQGKTIGYQDFYEALYNSIKKTASSCAKGIGIGEEGHEHLTNSILEISHILMCDNVKSYIFTSWCKFPFYKTDFGWGKPVWRSIPNIASTVFIVLMDDEEGDGVEVWAQLDKQTMLQLEQDPDMKEYAILAHSLSHN